MGNMGDSNEETIVTDMFQKADVKNRIPCSKCWAKYVCGGDCFYNSFLVNGNIYDPDPVTCSMNQFFIEHAMDLLIKLYMIDVKHIDYLAKILRLR